MKEPILSPKEKEQLDAYNTLFDAKRDLHQLLRRVVVSTKLGSQQKQPDDDIELDIGDDGISSCRKYEQVRYFSSKKRCEYELDSDIEAIQYLINEINKRFQEFRKARDSNKLRYIKGKKKFASEFFRLPLTKIEGDEE